MRLSRRKSKKDVGYVGVDDEEIKRKKNSQVAVEEDTTKKTLGTILLDTIANAEMENNNVDSLILNSLCIDTINEEPSDAKNLWTPRSYSYYLDTYTKIHDTIEE
eukprot:14563563-Ditylum_brightwellii.AAC.1